MKKRKILIAILVLSLLLPSPLVARTIIHTNTASPTQSGTTIQESAASLTQSNATIQASVGFLETVEVELNPLLLSNNPPQSTLVKHTNLTRETATYQQTQDSVNPEPQKPSLTKYIATEMENFNKCIDLSSYNLNYKSNAGKEKVMTKVFQSIVDSIHNNPELFFVDSRFSVTYSIFINGEGKTVGGSVLSAQPRYYMSKKKAMAVRKTFDSVVNQALKKVKTSMTRAQKARVIHDFLARHAKFDYKNCRKGSVPIHSYRANGVLVNRVGVCQSFAMAYKYIMEKKLKIKCVYAYTDTHIWNMVYVRKKNYNVDITWDLGTKKTVHHTWFLVGKKKMKRAHKGKHITFQKKPALRDYKKTIK